MNIWENRYDVKSGFIAGSRFKVQGSGLALGAARPLIVDESFARQLGVRSAGAAHKNMEAPRSINRAMPESLSIAGFPF